MSCDRLKIWAPILVAFLAGSIATALVPQTVPILGSIAAEFQVSGANLGWVVSFPTVVCALGALAFGVVVDRFGDVRLLLAGIVLVMLGDVGVSLAPALHALFAARLFQGLGYICITVAGPTFIQRITTGETRRAAMAFWAAHTPVGFAAAVFFAAQLVAAGWSWRWSFLGHAVVALLIGIAALTLRRAPSQSSVSRSAGTWRVLTTQRVYAVAAGALGAGLLQVGVMTLLPSLLADRHGFSQPQSALVIVVAMISNWAGAMLIVATRLRSMPTLVLPVSAAAATFLGFLTISGLAGDVTMELTFVLLFCATVGTANAVIWSLLPAAVPSPEAGGATAGLITQGSFIGVLIGPPTYFWIRHESALLIAALSVVLIVLMLVPLFAHPPARGSGAERAMRTMH